MEILTLTVSFHVKNHIAMNPWLCWPGANHQREHSSRELAQAEDTPVLRQSAPALLATAQAQNAKRVKVQDKPRKNPIQV